MAEIKREEILYRAEKVFFEAMVRGWAADVKGIPVLDMPGYKRIPPYERDGFCVVDQYCVGEMGSAGTTTISIDRVPIWFMSYCGFYPKEVVPFLKRALMAAYEKDEFFGGRGKGGYDQRLGQVVLTYYNYVDNRSAFQNFLGREFIESTRGGLHPVGFHNYCGVILI